MEGAARIDRAVLVALGSDQAYTLDVILGARA
jgi:hypothetical protein